jgi:predicted amidophosphoribosyltransferase
MPALFLSRSRYAAGMLRSMAVGAAQQLLGVVYPASCPCCGAGVRENGFLCAPCWSSFPFIERPFCERSGAPFAQDLGEGLLSPAVLADPPVWFRARAVARYEDGPARRLVHRLKYADRVDYAGPMGRWMARAGAELLADAELLVPVPLHRRRLFQRRFNQAAQLARAVAAASGRRTRWRWSASSGRGRRSGSPAPSGPTTCRAPSACRRRRVRASSDGTWCSWTTS